MESPVQQCTDSVTIAQWVDVEECEGLVALKDLHRRDLSCKTSDVAEKAWLWKLNIPLMILQKIHEAAILVGQLLR